jgi:hypothetical protein
LLNRREIKLIRYERITQNSSFFVVNLSSRKLLLFTLLKSYTYCRELTFSIKQPTKGGHIMAEVVKSTGVSKESGYLYYLGKDGNVWRSKMARAGKGGGNAEKVADAGVQRESGYLYFIDKGGNVARAPMARGRK